MSFFGNLFNGGGGGGNVPYNANSAWGNTATTNQAPALTGNINNANTNLNSLVAALQAQSNGQGPNPAQAMLNQATNQNIQQGAGMIASQKGISPALAASQIANQTANTNQTAAGQGAVMRANQQLQSQGQLGSVLENQLGINQGALSNQNQSIAGAYGAAQGQNASQGASTSSQNSTLLGGLGLAEGGEVPKYAEGGQTLLSSFFPSNSQTYQNSQNQMTQYQPPQTPFVYGVQQLYNAFLGPNSSTAANAGLPAAQTQAAQMESGSALSNGAMAGGAADAGTAATDAIATDAATAGAGDAAAALLAAKGGQVDKIKMHLMPDHLKLVHSLYHTPKMASGGIPTQNMKQGGQVPGEPQFPHTNTTKQDNVPALLTSKEIVLPLTVTQSANPPEAAKNFVANELRKHSQKFSDDDFKGAISRAAKSRRNS